MYRKDKQIQLTTEYVFKSSQKIGNSVKSAESN